MSNSTLASQARSFAREQALGCLAIPSLDYQFPTRVAVSPVGSFVLGSDVPVQELTDYRVQLFLSANSKSWIVAEGRLTAPLTRDPSAKRSFESLHPFDAPVGLLSADVIAWYRTEDDAYAFHPGEWYLGEPWPVEQTSETLQHLNERHGDLLCALVGGADEARAISIDADGLLIDCWTRLQHVRFWNYAASLDRALDEIFDLLRGLPEFHGKSRSAHP